MSPLTDTQKENLGHLVTSSHSPSVFVKELLNVKNENKGLKYNDDLKKLINKWIMEHRRQDDYKSIMLEYF
jgi:hemerythrin